MKYWANISENEKGYSCKFTQKERFGQGEQEVKSRQQKAKSLSNFAGSASASEDLSDREDEDIYAHYMEQMRKAKLEEAHEKVASNPNLTS